jgi:hypothetical protein
MGSSLTDGFGAAGFAVIAGLLCEPIPTMRWTVVDSPGASAKIAAPAMNAMTMIVGLFAMMLF